MGARNTGFQCFLTRGEGGHLFLVCFFSTSSTLLFIFIVYLLEINCNIYIFAVKIRKYKKHGVEKVSAFGMDGPATLLPAKICEICD